MQSYRAFIADPIRRPVVVAHRGAWHAAPENSLGAIRAAAEARADVVEIDIRRSVDGVLFLMHDDALDRTTACKGAAESRTMAELSAMPLRAGAGGPGTAATGPDRVPTLAAAFDAARAAGVYLDLDVKRPALLEPAAALAAEKGMSARVSVKMPVRTDDDVARLRQIAASHGIMVMPQARFGPDGAVPLAQLVATGAPMVEAFFDDPAALVPHRAALAAAGLSVWFNTLDLVAPSALSDSNALNDPDAVWGRLIAAGVSVFQTDHPAALARYLDTLG